MVCVPYQISRFYAAGFRNYHTVSMSFEAGMNGIVGKNGVGKTNLLDALYYALTARSAVATSDRPLVGEEQTAFGLKVDLGLGDDAKNQYRIHITYDKTKKQRHISVNTQTYETRAAYWGVFPVLFLSPKDTLIVQGSADTRRRFFDPLMAQWKPEYLKALVDYYKHLNRRNALLRHYQIHPKALDKALLASYDVPIRAQAAVIHTLRKAFVEALRPLFEGVYAHLSGTPHDEAVALEYRSHLNEASWEETYAQNQPQDIARATTTIGIHRDDYAFFLKNKPLRTHASRGQIKSYVLALQMGYFKLYSQRTKCYPIMLMDDLLDTLDETRARQLLEWLHPNQNQKKSPQCFITAPQKTKLQKLLAQWNGPAHCYLVENQNIHAL